ncbi:hypothetical protein [Halorubrum tebenquichense]|nr:hypothetical protein [Halorubrum tebenquichense]
MKRRLFLASAGIGLSTAVAGCTSQAPLSASSESDLEAGSNTSKTIENETDQKLEQTRIEVGDTTERTIGTGSLEERGLRTAHHVVFGNPTEATHHGTVTISTASETVFEESVVLEANASIVASLTDLGTYTVRVTVPELDATEVVTLDAHQFTCNVTKTTVNVQEDGALGSTSISTRMACPGVVSETAPSDEVMSHTLGDEPVPADTGQFTHTFMLRNPSDETWTARMLVEADSTAQFDGLYAVEPESTVLLTLTESSTYTLSVDVLETEMTASEQITPENFDCNQSSTRVEIDSEGELIMNTLSTLMACGTETNSTDESS